MTSIGLLSPSARGGSIPRTKSLSQGLTYSEEQWQSSQDRGQEKDRGVGYRIGQGNKQAQGTKTSAMANVTTGTARDSRLLHTHRQSHSSSKLPTYRFNDIKNSGSRIARANSSPIRHGSTERAVAEMGNNYRDGAKRESSFRPQASVLQKHIPPSPVSPNNPGGRPQPEQGLGCDSQKNIPAHAERKAQPANKATSRSQPNLALTREITSTNQQTTKTQNTAAVASCAHAQQKFNSGIPSAVSTHHGLFPNRHSPNQKSPILQCSRSRASTFQPSLPTPGATAAFASTSQHTTGAAANRPLSLPESHSAAQVTFRPIASITKVPDPAVAAPWVNSVVSKDTINTQDTSTSAETLYADATVILAAKPQPEPPTESIIADTGSAPIELSDRADYFAGVDATISHRASDLPSARNFPPPKIIQHHSISQQDPHDSFQSRPSGVSVSANDLSPDSTTVVIQPTTSKRDSRGRGNTDGSNSATASRAPSEEQRGVSRRPPISFKPPVAAASTVIPASGRAVIPPIRGFRSSGSRRSLVLDMNTRNSFPFEYGDDSPDSNHLDRTLRALEGKPEHEILVLSRQHQQRTPTDSADRQGPTDDGGDMFLRIAREEFAQKPSDEGREGSTVAKITRAAHNRRPYSAAVPAHQPNSPPRVTRRLSDQQETKRSRVYDDDRNIDTVSRPPVSREALERLTSASEVGRSRSAMKSNPATPRVSNFPDTVSESPGSYQRRRTSVTDNNANTPRTYKNSSLSYSKTYNSSPLVPKPEPTELGHGFESTESTSTNAPSVMWDEVDRMKSKLDRIQKKGTFQASSAISRGSDERPPTATTTVTTVSNSPKRTPGNAAHATDAISNVSSSHKEPQPLLHAALLRTKPVVTPEVYRALEATATDTMALTSMMGTAGQPGPISSGASSIGNSIGVTDRQLRRKADSVCRSLTELCIALTEDASQSHNPPPVIQTIEALPMEDEPIASPAVITFHGVQSGRRPSAALADGGVSLSPRNVSRLEDRRHTFMGNSNISSPRFIPNNAVEGNTPGAGRKSSLLISRTRRAGTEEPEDGRRSSMLLRTRRAGTEEPEEGRKSSLYVRTRRNTMGDDDEESRFRTQTRTNTELGSHRALQRERETINSQSETCDSGLGESALPRRRLAPSSLGSSRRAGPSGASIVGRRYLDRSTPDRETIIIADRSTEERSQRQYSRPSTVFGRSNSLSRRNRDSIISNLPTATANGRQ